MLSANEILSSFDKKNMVYEIQQLSDSYFIIISKHGGRIFGPYEDMKAQSIVWINDAARDNIDKFLQEGDWNIGGDRLWIAPELPFFAQKRDDFFNTYTVQREIDPGNYELSKRGDIVELSQQISVKLFEMPYENKSFSVQREIRRIENPLSDRAKRSELLQGIRYCGYEQEIGLTDLSPEKPMYLEAWNLSQIIHGGTMFVPYFGEFEYINYYSPIDEKIMRVQQGWSELKLNPGSEEKIGFSSAITFGRAAYKIKTSDTEYGLFIKNYDNNPSSIYCCEPYNQIGRTGCSLFVYINSDINGRVW